MDGGSGLANAIFLAMICMVVVPVGALGTLGWFATRKRHGWAGALAGICSSKT